MDQTIIDLQLDLMETVCIACCMYMATSVTVNTLTLYTYKVKILPIVYKSKSVL